MSASIFWRPIAKKHPYLSINSPSHFMEQCEKVWGVFPLTLEEKDLPKIDTLIDLGNDDFKKVKKVIDTHSKVKIWAEY